jgi:phospholipase C
MKISRHNHSKGSWKLLTSTLAFLLATTTLAACSNSTASTNSIAPGQTQSGDIHKIEHVVVIMQENRSFDSYFGTFPGADGIPMQINPAPGPAST